MTNTQIRHLAILECKQAQLIAELSLVDRRTTTYALLQNDLEIIQHLLFNANYKEVCFA